MNKLEQVLAELHEILSHRSDTGWYTVKSNGDNIVVTVVDYFWRDDEIIEGKYVTEEDNYSINYDENDNVIIEKASW